MLKKHPFLMQKLESQLFLIVGVEILPYLQDMEFHNGMEVQNTNKVTMTEMMTQSVCDIVDITTKAYKTAELSPKV